MFGSTICARFLPRLATVALCGFGAPVSCAPSAASLRSEANAYVEDNAPDWVRNGPPPGNFATGRSRCADDRDDGFGEFGTETEAKMRATAAIIEGRCPVYTTKVTTPGGPQITTTRKGSVVGFVVVDRFDAPCVTPDGQRGRQTHGLFRFKDFQCE